MKNDVKTRQRGNLAQYQSVANVLKVRMITIGMKQNELSERLGISQSRVSNYLNGKSEPDFYTLSKMAEHLKISLNDLIRNSGTLIADNDDPKNRGLYNTPSNNGSGGGSGSGNGNGGSDGDVNLSNRGYGSGNGVNEDGYGDGADNELNHPKELYKPFVMAKKLKIRDSITNTKNFVSLPPQVVKMINAQGDADATNYNDDDQIVILEVTEKIYSSRVVINSGDLVFAVPYVAGMDVGDDALLIKPGKNFRVVKLSRTLDVDGEHSYTALQEHRNQSREDAPSIDTNNLEGFFLVTAVLQVM